MALMLINDGVRRQLVGHCLGTYHCMYNKVMRVGVSLLLAAAWVQS